MVSHPLCGAIVNKAIVGMKLVQILPGILVSFPLSFPFIAMISVLRDTQL